MKALGFIVILALAATAPAPRPTELVLSVTTQNSVFPGLEDLAKLGGELPPELKKLIGTTRTLEVALTTTGTPPPGAVARLTVPESLKLGKELTLELPTAAKPGSATPKFPDLAMRIYWGSSDEIGPGQPKLIDAKSLEGSAKLTTAPGKFPPTVAVWPSAKTEPTPMVADDASLAGAYKLTISYAGTTPFELDQSVDFLAPIKLTAPKSDDAFKPAQPIKLEWQPVPGVSGYTVQAMGSPDGRHSVFWWSSSTYAVNGLPFDFTAPERIAVLIRDGLALPPDATAVTIPRNIFKGCDSLVVYVTAFGSVKTMPVTPTVRVQVKSVATLVLGAPEP